MDKKKTLMFTSICFAIIGVAICTMAYFYRSIEIMTYLIPLVILAYVCTLHYNNQIEWQILKNEAVLKIWIAVILLLSLLCATICYHNDSLFMMVMLIPLILTIMIAVMNQIYDMAKISKDINANMFAILSVALIIVQCAILFISFSMSDIQIYRIFASTVMLAIIFPMITEEIFKKGLPEAKTG